MNANIDNEEMRAYLLGTLDAHRRTIFEERFLRDPEVYEELLAAEEELIDEYVAGDLSEVERLQFEAHYAITAERQNKMRFGTLLRTYADSLPAPFVKEPEPVVVGQLKKTAPATKHFSIFLPLMRRPALTFGALLVAGLAILALCLLTMKKAAEQRALEQGESSVIMATLSPGSTRAGGTTNRVTVPPRGRFKVKFELELTNASFINYKSQLFRESESLLTSNELKKEARGTQQVVPVVIGGEYLVPGDYQLRLSGVLDSGADEFIDNYSFRIAAE